MKQFQCRDILPSCDWKVQGDSEDEILSKAEEHGKQVHGFQGLTDEQKKQVRSRIRDVQAA